MVKKLKTQDKNIRRVKNIFILLYIALVVYIIKIVVIDNTEISINPYNPRLSALENNVLRGRILDRNKTVLAYTDENKEDLRFARKYPYDKVFSHVLGYSAKTKTGIEAVANKYLLKTDVFANLFRNKKDPLPKGMDVVTTLDLKLQKKAYDLLGSKKGAIVIMEPGTGKILSMVSKPDYNPNQVVDNWKKISNDESKPLLNRVTQGLYPPGSIFKIVTSLAFIKHGDYNQFKYICKGKDVFDNDVIKCYNQYAHGEEDLKKAFTVSCNTAFANIGIRVGGAKLKEVSEQLYFNKKLNLNFPYVKSSVEINENSKKNELAETSIGQGKTLVTPMHMAMITSAIANAGMVYEPYLIDSILNPEGNVMVKNKPKSFTNMIEYNNAQILKEMMRNVVTEGTGVGTNISNIKVFGKTGTAENETEIAHSWFVGFSDTGDKSKDIAIAILVINGGSSSKNAVPMAKRLFQFHYKR